MQISNTNFRSIMKIFLCLAVAYGLAFSVEAAAADLNTARELLSQHKYDEAAVAAKDYLSDHPGDTQARFIRGLALARSGNVDAAIALFQQLAKDYPNLAEPRNNLGVLYAQQKKFEKAREVLEEAVKLNPNHGAAQENLGDVYVALARKAYAKTSQLEQDNIAVRTKRERLQTLLDTPRSQTYAKKETAQQSSKAPASSTQPAPSQAIETSADNNDEPQNAAPKTAGSGDDAQIRNAVNAWAQAWAAQNVSAYLNAYSDDFVPASGQSQSAWKRVRRERITKPNDIHVGIEDLQIQTTGENSANAYFTQTYKTSSYHDRVSKTLDLKHEHDGWRIVRETTN